jgi:hypothetical protein
MTNWQQVQWDSEGNVIAPEFAVQQGATWPLLVRFTHGDGHVSRNVSNRYNLTCEGENYLKVEVAPVVWPEDEA